jgi:hypothetical protein
MSILTEIKTAMANFIMENARAPKKDEKGIFGLRAHGPDLAEHMEAVNEFESYMVRTGRWSQDDLDLTTKDEFAAMARANSEFEARRKAEQAARDKTMTANAIAYATGKMETPVPVVPTVSMHYNLTPFRKK